MPAWSMAHLRPSVLFTPDLCRVPDTTNYLNIGAGTETITFNSDKDAFGLYWGSVDVPNSIAFYHGATLVASYTGFDIQQIFSSSDRGEFWPDGYVEFVGLAPFDKVVLADTGNAFEIDNVSAGSVPVPIRTAVPISGTLSVHDADIGDTLTASVTGNATIEYNGSTTLPAGADVAALIDANAVTFDSVTTNGGTEVLNWSYDPSNPDLDFLKVGDTLTLTYMAQVNDGHGSVGNQPLTITVVGTDKSADVSQFTVVNGTSQNAAFNNVNGSATMFATGATTRSCSMPASAARRSETSTSVMTP